MYSASAQPTAGQPTAELTIVVPTRNESDNIAPLLNRLGDALTGRSFEVLFVDDSTDHTPAVIRQEATTRPFPVSVIARPEDRRNGLSGAVVEGMEAASGRWLCVIDADLQHPPEIIPQLLDQANRTGADIVVASRKADFLGPMGLSRARALTSQLLTILARMVFPRVLKNVSDPLTGFFLARRAAIDTAELQPEGFKILLEILVRHPDLRVTELHFDFSPRHGGQSKADLHEGMRFFRHLLRLRLTINQHLIRFLILLTLASVLNLSLLIGLSAAGVPVLRVAAIAGSATIAGVMLGEMWVFSDRPRGAAQRRLAGVLFLGLAYLFIVYLPVVWLLAQRLNMPIWGAGLAAMIVAGFVYYLFSEQWIWTRGLMMRPRASLYYDIHGLIMIDSQIPLSDLAYFQVTSSPARIDLQLRVDRHGTPSRIPGAICYDEHLGRFGFGLTVVPGNFTEIIVSPLLETSPAFLFTNVVEPVLRWLMVTRGHSLARVAAVRLPVTGESTNKQPRPGLLIAGPMDMGYGLGRLCRDEAFEFMADERVIIGQDRLVHSFPKPVPAVPEMFPARTQAARSSIMLRLRRLLYARPIRRLGLYLTERQLPAATLNTYLQRLVPQPKFPLDQLIPGIDYGDEATPILFISQEKGEESLAPMPLDAVIGCLLEPGERSSGFQPYPLLIDTLAVWNGQDWNAEEQAILRRGLDGCTLVTWRHGDANWWARVGSLLRQAPERDPQRPAVLATAATLP